jgi:hypothetical protein
MIGRLGGLLFLIGSVAQAGQLASQAALTAALGGSLITENFNHFSVASGIGINLTCATLNSSAVCNSQGPGLVVQGINIAFGSGQGQWNGVSYYGSPAQEVGSHGQPVTVTFTTPVTAFGLNVRAYVGFPATATVTMLATDNVTVVGTIPNIVLDSVGGTTTFAGWQNTAGIGAVQITQTGQTYGGPIEALQFGGTPGGIAPTTTPAPSTWVLFAIGLAALGLLQWRRKLLNS